MFHPDPGTPAARDIIRSVIEDLAGSARAEDIKACQQLRNLDTALDSMREMQAQIEEALARPGGGPAELGDALRQLAATLDDACRKAESRVTEAYEQGHALGFAAGLEAQRMLALLARNPIT